MPTVKISVRDGGEVTVNVRAFIKGEPGSPGSPGSPGQPGIGITGGGEIVIDGAGGILYFRKGLSPWFVLEGAAFSGEPPTGSEQF